MQISPVITAADTKPSDIATNQYPQGIPYDPTVYSSNSVARKGALAVGSGSDWAALEVGTDGYVLTCSAAAADGVAWTAPATHGTVTSVTLTGDGTVLSNTPTSAVTASGTLTAALAAQAANIVLAGPTSGATAVVPTFRALVTADLPAVIAATTITIGSNHMTWGAAAPSTGTWAVGDICWNTAAAAGGSPGWVNTSASGSGTWKTMPIIQA